MDSFSYQNQEAVAEAVPLEKIANEIGTPVYIYSKETLVRHCRAFSSAFSSHPTLLCYAIKANANLSLLREIFSHGFGADVVSLGELERAKMAGASPSQIGFSGVGKTPDEIRRGLEYGILSFNVESEFELDLISRVASEMAFVAQISVRLNPNIDAKTHPHIATGLYTTKFGIAENEAKRILETIKTRRSLRLIGLTCHLGSQITELGPYREAALRMVEWAKIAMGLGHRLEILNMGGGLGIQYQAEKPPPPPQYALVLIEAVRPTGLRLVIEPGRSIVGNAGVLLTRVLGVKKTPVKTFVVVDAGMNDLMRPALYHAAHTILPVKQGTASQKSVEVVGPICETTDVLGTNVNLSEPTVGDLLFIRSAGAYGSSMSSTYNCRPLVPEVLVDGSSMKIIRKRQPLHSLWELEQ